MTEEKKFTMWSVNEKDLEGVLTPAKAREIIEDCFFHAQKETRTRSRQSIGLKIDDEEMRRSVKGIVRLVFSEIGGNYDSPAKADLIKVVQSLGAKAKSWGTPDDVIAHHQKMIQRVLDRTSA